MKVIYLLPQCEPRELYLDCQEDDCLEALQALVGGYIECTRADGGLVIIGNEEGLLHGLQPNIRSGSTMLVGPLVFVRENGPDFKSIIPGDLSAIKTWLKQIERPGFIEYDIPAPVIGFAAPGEDIEAFFERSMQEAATSGRSPVVLGISG